LPPLVFHAETAFPLADSPRLNSLPSFSNPGASFSFLPVTAHVSLVHDMDVRRITDGGFFLLACAFPPTLDAASTSHPRNPVAKALKFRPVFRDPEKPRISPFPFSSPFATDHLSIFPRGL